MRRLLRVLTIGPAVFVVAPAAGAGTAQADIRLTAQATTGGSVGQPGGAQPDFFADVVLGTDSAAVRVILAPNIEITRDPTAG